MIARGSLGEKWIDRAERIFTAVKILCMVLQWWVRIIIHLSKPVECTTLRVNPNVNYGLWVIFMCHWRLINCNKCPSVLNQDVDYGGVRAWVGVASTWEISILSSQFCCKPKIALKKIKPSIKINNTSSNFKSATVYHVILTCNNLQLVFSQEIYGSGCPQDKKFVFI